MTLQQWAGDAEGEATGVIHTVARAQDETETANQ